MKRSLLFGLFCLPVKIITIILLLKIAKIDESIPHLPIFGLIGGICVKKFQNEFYSVLYNDIRTTHL